MRGGKDSLKADSVECWLLCAIEGGSQYFLAAGGAPLQNVGRKNWVTNVVGRTNTGHVWFYLSEV